LLEAVGEAPMLSREAAARIRSRVQKGGKGGRGARTRSNSVGPLFLEPRISLLAAGIALLVILGALVVLLLGEPPRAKAPPVDPVPAVEPKHASALSH
jgi:hypothetical protein